MALRTDLRQYLIYDPDTVEDVLRTLEAASLIMFGSWLQQRAQRLPAEMADNVGTIGSILWEIGNARQQINAGLAPTEHLNEATETQIYAQRGYDKFVRWLRDPSSVPIEQVADIMDQIAGAMSYLHMRTDEVGTNHPRWVARLTADHPCQMCGR